MPMGMEIPLTCQELIASPMPGMVWERSRPIPIQRATHTKRDLSNLLIFISLSSIYFWQGGQTGSRSGIGPGFKKADNPF